MGLTAPMVPAVDRTVRAVVAPAATLATEVTAVGEAMAAQEEAPAAGSPDGIIIVIIAFASIITRAVALTAAMVLAAVPMVPAVVLMDRAAVPTDRVVGE